MKVRGTCRWLTVSSSQTEKSEREARGRALKLELMVQEQEDDALLDPDEDTSAILMEAWCASVMPGSVSWLMDTGSGHTFEPRDGIPRPSGKRGAGG